MANQDFDDDDQHWYGDHVECWQCGGEGGWEDDDPFWPIEWVRCDVCKGKGGWICEDPAAPGAPNSAAKEASHD